MGFEPILTHPQCVVLPLHHKLRMPAPMNFREADEILPLDAKGLKTFRVSISEAPPFPLQTFLPSLQTPAMHTIFAPPRYMVHN
jgi:hypothetical protein